MVCGRNEKCAENMECMVLMCAVRRHEAAALHKIIKDTDNKAFVLVTDAGEIIGEGFKQ